MTSRTLVVHTGGIGDFLLACPSVELLSKEGPLELVGLVDRLQLAVAGGIAESARSLQSVDFETILDRPSDRLRQFLSGFQRVVVWMRDDDKQISQNLAACGVSSVHVNPGLPPKDWTQHASGYYTHCLGLRKNPDFKLRIDPGNETYDIVIHPGSGSPTKNWPLTYYNELSKRLTDVGRKVTWCLGPAERDAQREGYIEAPPEVDILSPDSLVELAQTLCATRHYIGNDSGITHLAAAVDCPTIALFGPTNPDVWAPLGSLVVRFETANPEAIAQLILTEDPD